VYARINGVSGNLSLAQFRCPLALHAATCGLIFLGEPIVLNILAHFGLKALEYWTWAEFYPEPEGASDFTSEERRELRDGVTLRIEAGASEALESFPVEKVEFRGGRVELLLESRTRKVYQVVWGRHGSSYRLPDYVSYPVISFQESTLLYEEAASERFIQVTNRAGETTVREISRGCAQIVLFNEMR
jgi:hypothetical protein